jgi:hypothetical protein
MKRTDSLLFVGKESPEYVHRTRKHKKSKVKRDLSAGAKLRKMRIEEERIKDLESDV